MNTIEVSSKEKNEIIDITSEVSSLINIKSGTCVVYCPHTTGAITTNENYDSDVKRDMIQKLNELSPDESYYQHSEGNSDAHVKSSLIGNSETFIIEENKLVLGQWQGVFFYEFDGPRNRTIFVKIMGE